MTPPRKKRKMIGYDDWILQDTGFISLPDGEQFVSFIKVKRRMYILSNKSVYKIVGVK